MNTLTTKDMLSYITLSIGGLILIGLGLIYVIQINDVNTGITITILGSTAIIYARMCVMHTELQNLIKRSDQKVPSISIYVNDELYKYLYDKGPSPSKAGKDIIESEYNRQKETENATQ